MRTVVYFLPGIALAVFNIGWDMIGYQNPTLGYVLWGLAAALLIIGAWPWIKRWRPFTLAPANGIPVNEEPEEIKELRSKNDELEAESETLKRIQDDQFWDQIKSWRDRFDTFDYDTGNVRETSAYSTIRPYLKGEVVDRLEGTRPLLISTVKPMLLNEVTRLQQELESGGPNPQLFSSDTDAELKRRCRWLAEELATFLDNWEHYRDQPKIFPEKPGDWQKYTTGEYRSKFDQKLASLLDDLERREWLTPEARAHFEVPTDDPQTIRKVVARLSSIGQRD